MENKKNKRINVTLSEELFLKLKERADLLGSSVPSVLVFYAVQGINQENAINSINSMMSVLEKMGGIEKLG